MAYHIRIFTEGIRKSLRSLTFGEKQHGICCLEDSAGYRVGRSLGRCKIIMPGRPARQLEQLSQEKDEVASNRMLTVKGNNEQMDGLKGYLNWGNRWGEKREEPKASSRVLDFSGGRVHLVEAVSPRRIEGSGYETKRQV